MNNTSKGPAMRMTLLPRGGERVKFIKRKSIAWVAMRHDIRVISDMIASQQTVRIMGCVSPSTSCSNPIVCTIHSESMTATCCPADNVERALT